MEIDKIRELAGLRPLSESSEMEEAAGGIGERMVMGRIKAAKQTAREVSKALDKIKSEVGKGEWNSTEGLQELGALAIRSDSELSDIVRRINGVLSGTSTALG